MLIASAVGVKLNPELADAITTAGMAVGGLVLSILPDTAPATK